MDINNKNGIWYDPKKHTKYYNYKIGVRVWLILNPYEYNSITVYDFQKGDTKFIHGKIYSIYTCPPDFDGNRKEKLDIISNDKFSMPILTYAYNINDIIFIDYSMQLLFKNKHLNIIRKNKS